MSRRIARRLAALALVAVPIAGCAEAPALNLTAGLPEGLWYEAPNTVPPGDGRMRIVTAGSVAAALTPNQWWHYSRAYDRHLAQLTLRGQNVIAARPTAQRYAMADLIRRYPSLAVPGFVLDPIEY
ncbi:hypothetical protein [Jannaschia rubra]|uniref:hypothetical protein n=1 Tax=Jannaschia rubra TaxID=282197 RepID=UPI0024929E4C|nr:hypothetical protein [Jannaschia rubra]